MKRRERIHERGTILITFTVMLILLIAFAGLCMEAGRWYLLRSELSKTVDAAALIGARNIGNPNVDAVQIAQEFATENFKVGGLGTPNGGAGTASFTAVRIGVNKIQVTGNASSPGIFAQVLGSDFTLIPVTSVGQARQNQVELMLVLDRSGSMSGTPIADLKTAAKTFVNFFTPTQAQDHMGMISFGTAAIINRTMANNYAASMTTAINNLNAGGWTNTEDAIDQCSGPGGFTDQSGLPANDPDRIQQFMVLFSDGVPTAWRGKFLYKGVQYDGVIGASCDNTPQPFDDNKLWSPTVEGGSVAGMNAVLPTGDGLAAGSACGNTTSVRWFMFDNYPVPGYTATACTIPTTAGGPLATQNCWLVENLAYLHATQLKDAKIGVYTIGLGNINKDFLTAVASAPDMYYQAPTSGDLTTLFQHVAEDIKLKLVQ